MDIKRLSKVNMTQVDLIFELRERGYEIQPPTLSNILRGVYTYPKAKVILAECEKILSEKEHGLV